MKTVLVRRRRRQVNDNKLDIGDENWTELAEDR